MAAARSAAETTLTPDRDTTQWLSEAGVTITEKTTVARLMQRHDFDTPRFLTSTPLMVVADAFRALTEEELEGVASQLRYAGYIDRQEREAARRLEDDDVRIPRELVYAMPGLSREMVEKLSFVQPASLGQASRIPGVTPAAISILRMHLRRRDGGRLANRAL
jgi:tRNA uridine 5-carboxymethylaminomethyl modification enzyme